MVLEDDMDHWIYVLKRHDQRRPLSNWEEKLIEFAYACDAKNLEKLGKGWPGLYSAILHNRQETRRL